MTTFGLQQLAEHGITSAVDARNYWNRNNHLAWKKALDNNKLTAKIILSHWAYPEMDDTTQINKLKDLYRNDPDKRLRQNQIKVYMDGIVTSTTAKMKTPYNVTIPEINIGNKGMNYFTQERLQSYISQLEGKGYNFLIHAIGDQGVHEALNAIQNVQNAKSRSSRTARHKLTHVELVDPADINRFAALNVIADPQVF